MNKVSRLEYIVKEKDKEIAKRDAYIRILEAKLSLENLIYINKKYSLDYVEKCTKFAIKIRDLGLKARTINVLDFLNIKTVGDLCAHKKADISSIQGAGPFTMRDLDDLLKSLDLKWGMNSSDYAIEAVIKDLKNS